MTKTPFKLDNLWVIFNFPIVRLRFSNYVNVFHENNLLATLSQDFYLRKLTSQPLDLSRDFGGPMHKGPHHCDYFHIEIIDNVHAQNKSKVGPKQFPACTQVASIQMMMHVCHSNEWREHLIDL